ncbi:AMP-binding protein [Paracoccus caeni]|uniref:AMP-binding protein n=1 Tax=Paracoccus caeni TaxID=657651 RepID=A0A934SI24_9RHOB|nr:AMP-binding protein [Paracoccus caeni]MBK4214843.1 AMP-binding protein [Paracoccus caeni]
MTPPFRSIADELAEALPRHADRIALRDRGLCLTYAQLAAFTEAARPVLAGQKAVAVYGVPGALFGAAVTACVIDGRPFVHLDPAMPKAVLGNILSELSIDLILTSQEPKEDQLPPHVRVVDAASLLGEAAGAATRAAQVLPSDAIYLVATSGTTGRPKCIPVTHDSALLSYHWREEYAPYHPGMKVGVYIFAIWEMFRPLRHGAEVCFPGLDELLSPQAFVAFLSDHGIQEMLFTPSFLEKILDPVDAGSLAGLPLERIILNGEVVSNRLISEIRTKLPQAKLWNLYSICETHDICMSELTGPSTTAGVTVGRAMPYLRAVVLDDDDKPCPPGVTGLLHFEGPRMLGPGYIDRPEETARRFRELQIEGRKARLYDTGDQGYVAEDGQITVLGRVAHMLKLRGHSIQTRELSDTMAGLLRFTQAIPWVREIAGQGQALVFYYTADAAQQAHNAQNWQIEPSDNRMPEALSAALRKVLPAYCVPSYLLRLDAIPIHQVSGKCDYKALPDIVAAEAPQDSAALPTVAHAARILRCGTAQIDAARSFHDQGGDSLMCVDLILSLETHYQRRVDFDWALNLPLIRLHQLLTDAPATATTTGFDRKGILLTGATGFLGGHVLAAALERLPLDEVVYCLIRPRNRDAQSRLDTLAPGLDHARIVAVTGSIDDPRFGLDGATYDSLCRQVRQVIHCAATVNLAVDRARMEEWSRTGIQTVLQFCRDAGADLRFSSSSAVFPETGGPHPEGPTTLYEGCSGYGAAKIAAEAEIAASGIPAAIVRLPSLYDLDAPNVRDICEIILAACREIGSVPAGLTFPMTDVRAAAAFLVGLPALDDLGWHNLIADAPLRPKMPTLPPETWLARAPLSDAVRRLIASDPLILQADARFENAQAKAAWRHAVGGDFVEISDAEALLSRRLTYQSEPALI